MSNAEKRRCGAGNSIFSSRTNLLLGLVQGFYWMASCIFVSFLVRLLHHFGYNDYISGLVLMISSVATIMVQPLLGNLADRISSVKWLIVGALCVAAAAAILLLVLSQYLVWVFVLIFVIFATFRSQIYIIDLWSLRVGQNDPKFRYGFTRSFGSVFYAVSAVFFGYAIDKASGAIIIPVFVGMIVLDVLVVLLVKEPDTQRSVQKRASDSVSLQKAVGILMKNRPYVILLISYCLVEMSSVPLQNYLTRKFEGMGAGDFYVGLSFLIMGLLQIPTLLCMDRIHKRVTPARLMIISLTGIALRCSILALGTHKWVLVSAFLTEFFAFGLYIGTIHVYLRGILPSYVLYFGTTLYSAISSGFGGILGNYLAGYLAESIGVNAMMYILAIPGICGLVLFLLSNVRQLVQKSSLEERI